MILAAGFGTRLMPHTKNKPKALVKVAGKPMIDIIIRKLIRSGYDSIVINVHHFAEQIIAYVNSRRYADCTITFSIEKDKILDTGGGVKFAKRHFNKKLPVLVHNVDILSDIDLNDMQHVHDSSSNLITLAVKQRKTSRSLLFGNDGYLAGWRNNQNNETKISRYLDDYKDIAFSGIHIFDSRAIDLMPKVKEFSLIDFYLRIAADKNVGAYNHDYSYWLDMGRPENLKLAEDYLMHRE